MEHLNLLIILELYHFLFTVIIVVQVILVIILLYQLLIYWIGGASNMMNVINLDLLDKIVRVIDN